MKLKETVPTMWAVVRISMILFGSWAMITGVCPSAWAASTGTGDEKESDMTLQGGQEGTVFRDLVVEGEDRIRVEFDRPDLHVDIDPQSAPGLEWGGVEDVLERSSPDLVSPYLQTSALRRSPYRARPWLDEFAHGEIARFQPRVEGVHRWKLIVANSRGEAVAGFEGNGKPPKQIGWDGRSLDGTPVLPGLTYSYVLEAYDRAGNKRSFVGEGFKLPSYRLMSEGGLAMVFTGEALSGPANSISGPSSIPPAILLEVASRVNESSAVDRAVRVEVTARTYDRAKSLSAEIVGRLEPLVLGGPMRIQPVTNVKPDAPEDGTIEIAVSR